MRGKKALTGLAVFAAMTLALGLALYSALDLVPDPLAGPHRRAAESVRILDREGRVMRAFLSGQDTRGRWTPLAGYSPYLIQAAVAAEDQRFYRHFGVDPLAVLRAVYQNLRAGRVVSGASTITMQLARLLDPGPRTFKRKVLEAVRALAMEKRHDKNRIIEEYLNRAPCGNLTVGLAEASYLYLDKSPSNLSPAEAAFLMALPQAPTTYNPYKRPGQALARRNLIIGRMTALGYLEKDQADRAGTEKLDLRSPTGRFQAPHFTRYVRELLPDPPPESVRTTIDAALQEQVERLTARAVARGREDGIGQAAVVVLDHQTREVLAWVGSPDFFDPEDGQNDGVLAHRQPGSSVKPFTYASAFDRWLSPSDLIDDSPVDYGLDQGVYRPENYDRRFRGKVPARMALASSLNVPAVKVLEHTGLDTVHRLMKAAGLKSLTQEPDYYGLGLTLGDGEVTLLELANAYATLASGGVYRPPVVLAGQGADFEGVRVFSEQASWLVTNVLSDDAARAGGFGRDSLLELPFPAAAKTGTSKNFRDNWTVGYTSRIVVAVWAGNFDAEPMGRVSGISGAGPLWREVMRAAADRYPPGSFIRPKGIVELTVCSDTGLRAGPGCPNRRTDFFIPGRLPGGICLEHNRTAGTESPSPDKPSNPGAAILSPRPGERYLFDPGIETGFQNILLSARGKAGPDWLVWYVNGAEAGRTPGREGRTPDFLWPLSRGRMDIRLVGLSGDRKEVLDQVRITVY